MMSKSMAHNNGLLGFDVTLNNACNYLAMQFDMLLPSEVKFHDVCAVSMSDHIVSFRELDKLCKGNNWY